MSFVDSHIQWFGRDIFHLFQSCAQLLFKNTTIDELHQFLARVLEWQLEEFIFESHFPDNYEIPDFFGKTPYSYTLEVLHHVKIQEPTTSFYSISEGNFSIMPYLKTLELPNCGIQIIHDHAFDIIASTLETLNLAGNELKRIQPALLHNIIAGITSIFRGANLSDNPFACGCEFDLMVELGDWRTVRGNQSMFVSTPTCQHREMGLVERRCDYDVLHPPRLCLNLTTFQRIYPKYSIKSEKATSLLQIKTLRTDRYRVWIHSNNQLESFNTKWGYKEKKCPKKGYLQAEVRCFVVSGSIELLLLEFLQHSRSNMVCINYALHDRVAFWPLYCVTQSIAEVGNSSPFTVVLLLTSSIGGIALAFVVLFAYSKWQNKSLDELQKEPEVFSENFTHRFVRVDHKPKHNN